jgi:Zn-dependent M28 family amino/carboxypeptidase
VLLTSHVDAHDIAEGAMDNGAGTAVVLEVAKALKTRENDLDRRVHVVVYGAEEVGLCGSTFDRNQWDAESIKAIVNNDGVARGRTLKCYSHSFPGLEQAIETVAARFDHPIETTPELGPHSDHWPYVQRGIPGIHVMSVTEGEGRGWGHTRADTLDKLEPRVLREQSILLTELVTELAGDTVTTEMRDQADIAAQLEEEDLAEGMKIIGDWPY